MSVATMRQTLQEDDIRRLIRGDTPEDRASVAHKICRRIDTARLSPADKANADQIIGILAEDAAAQVRRALAVTLRNSPNLPRDIAVKLSRDIDAIAAPVLKNSPVLTEDDLIELTLGASTAKQVAVAEREDLPEGVVEVIAEHGDREAVEAAALNEGASFSDLAYERMLNRYKDDDGIKGAVISRSEIPIHIAEKMVSMVTGHLFDRLVNTHELPPQLAIEIASNARERATLDLVEQAGRTSDPTRFAQQLNLNGRLTPSLVMRALCLGHMTFVEHALSELAGVPHSKAWLMIHDAGALGLKTMFERAGLPAGMFTAFKLAVEVYHNTDMDGGPRDRERFRQRMTERVLTQFQAIPRSDLEYLLEKLDNLETDFDVDRAPSAQVG
ncbi:MAG: DUF2336 domain-containing protein [Pseudomonadota bacterium]